MRMNSSRIPTHFHKHNYLRVNREKPAIVLGGPPQGTTPRTEDAAIHIGWHQLQTTIFLLRSGPLRPSAGLLALTEYRPDGGNRCDQPDEGECRTDSLSLLYTEAVREK